LCGRDASQSRKLMRVDVPDAIRLKALQEAAIQAKSPDGLIRGSGQHETPLVRFCEQRHTVNKFTASLSQEERANQANRELNHDMVLIMIIILRFVYKLYAERCVK
jgi:hypothetical protein